ncbi:unnamed protein product [Rotaria sp. Silwood1]|nr:unnamed protein product [Rotaria sp. Silwood1]
MEAELPRTRCRRLCKFVCKYGIKLTGALLLPLLLAVFTVVITLEQKKDADKQRLEDRQIAQIQRFEDRELAREQRQQDLNISIAARALERDLANERKDLEYELSEKVRLSNDEQRKHELYIQEENRFFALTQGTWFIQTGYVLYPQTTNPAFIWEDTHESVSLLTMSYAYHLAGNTMLLIVLYLLVYLLISRTSKLNHNQVQVDESLNGYKLISNGNDEVNSL